MNHAYSAAASTFFNSLLGGSSKTITAAVRLAVLGLFLEIERFRLISSA